jgi:thiol:disulfide interchange protein DsbD
VALSLALLAGSMAGHAAAQADLLAPERAFALSARAWDERTLEASFAIAGGYYLYRSKLKFAVDPTPLATQPVLPPGKIKDDEFFGRVETYRTRLVVRLPLERAVPDERVTVTVESQGCADAGVCYPANRQKVTLAVPQPGKGPGTIVEAHPRKKNWFN